MSHTAMRWAFFGTVTWLPAWSVTVTVVLSVAAALADGDVSVVLPAPQAARERTIATASSRAVSFFAVFIFSFPPI